MDSSSESETDGRFFSATTITSSRWLAPQVSDDDSSESEISIVSEESELEEEGDQDPDELRKLWVLKRPDAEEKIVVQKPKIQRTKKKLEAKEPTRDERMETSVRSLLGEVTQANLNSRVSEIMIERGRKDADFEAVFAALEKLLEIAELPYQRIKVNAALASCYFDYSTSQHSYLPVPQWKMAANKIEEILNDLSSDLVLSEVITDEEENETRVRCSLCGQIDRLDLEFTKSLQKMDLQGPEFPERLRDEIELYKLILRAEDYFRSIKNNDSLVRMVLRRVEHMYFKKDRVNQIVEEHINATGSFDELVQFLFNHGSERAKVRALLCAVHHYSFDQFQKARDMLLMSQVHNSIHLADQSTQSLYNRTVVQLGLSAFEIGNMKDCLECLSDIVSSQRTRELLNEGFMVPNYELIETVYLVASMIQEAPYIAYDQGKRRQHTKTFRRIYESSERSAYQGPPETPRDHVMAATKALVHGNFLKSIELISQIKVLNLLNVKISEYIKETALVTWLYICHGYTDSINLCNLATHFDLSMQTTLSLVSKLVASDKIQGKIDGIANMLLLSGPMSRVQFLSNQLAEKLCSFE